MTIKVTELNWIPQPGGATDIAVTANGSAWVVGTSPVVGGYDVYYWDGSNWGSVGGSGVRIAVAPDGTPWVVNDVGNIFIFSGGSWQQLPGAATDIGIGLNGSVWITGRNPVQGGYDIYSWNGANWDRVEGGGVRIAVGRDGTPWLVNNAGNIFVLDGGGWQLLPGAATDIGVSVNGPWVTGISPIAGGYDIYYWNGAEWVEVAGAGVNISASIAPWVVNDAGNIFSSQIAVTG